MNEKQKKIASLILLATTSIGVGAPSSANANELKDKNIIQEANESINVFPSGVEKILLPHELFYELNQNPKGKGSLEKMFFEYDTNERLEFYNQIFQHRNQTGELNVHSMKIFGMLVADIIAVAELNENNIVIQKEAIELLQAYVTIRPDLSSILPKVELDDLNKLQQDDNLIVKASQAIAAEVKNQNPDDEQKKDVVIFSVVTLSKLGLRYQNLENQQEYIKSIDTGKELFGYAVENPDNLSQTQDLFLDLSYQERKNFYYYQNEEKKGEDLMTFGMLGLLASGMITEAVVTRDKDVARDAAKLLNTYFYAHPAVQGKDSDDSLNYSEAESIDIATKYAKDIETEMFTSRSSKEYPEMLSRITKQSNTVLGILNHIVTKDVAIYLKKMIKNKATGEESKRLFEQGNFVQDSVFHNAIIGKPKIKE